MLPGLNSRVNRVVTYPALLLPPVAKANTSPSFLLLLTHPALSSTTETPILERIPPSSTA